jgi:hypothetical protein
MAHPIDLGGKLALAINGANDRGHPIVVGYVDDAGRPSISFRGSVIVLGSNEIGLWVRKTDSGLAVAIEKNPHLALLFLGNLPDGSRLRAALNGRARVDRSRNTEVYDKIGDVEQRYDPEANGAAVIVEIDRVSGMTEDGPFEQGSI